MLLQWVVLQPSGPQSNLAAIRFSSSVKIHSLKIFPTGARPFKNNQEIVATTIPNSFYLDVYFNAQPIASTDSKNKPKPSNVLVPTSIAYQGGQVEFIVDSESAEFATRLMIIRGTFEKLSLAIYGDVASESSTSTLTYNPRQIPEISQSPLPPGLDVANKTDPTELAQSLLNIIPEGARPQLSLIIRLMFCLKPSNEDWEEKDFPHLYSDLEHGLDDITLDKAVSMTARPVIDTVNEHVLRNFAQRLGESITEYDDDQAYSLAKLLSQCAPQHSLLVRFVLENIDLARMYTVPNLDRPTLLYLLDAAASLDVSRHLNNEKILKAIAFISDNSSYDTGARNAASRLYKRIKGWEVLEDSFLNTQAQFREAAAMVRDFAAEENTFGIWLENMILNHDIQDKLSENPPTIRVPYPPLLWQFAWPISHDDFIAFIRASIGVAAVIAVYAWSDSVPVDDCRERALAILRLWQNISGYREIVNHFMLMRQLAYRLECMLPLESDLPSQAAIDAEHILKKLALQPISMLRVDFVKVMQNLKAPLNYITDVEVEQLRRASALAKDGTRGAIKLLLRPPEDLELSERRLDLRIAIVIIGEAINTKEEEVLGLLWEQNASTLPVYLIRYLKQCCSEIVSNFGLDFPPRRKQSEIASAFQTSFEILNLLKRLVASQPLVSRDATSLTECVCDIFVCTDSADMYTSQDHETCIIAHALRQTCLLTLISLVVPQNPDEQSIAIAATSLNALLTRATHPGPHNAAHYLIQVFWLLDHILSYVQYDAPEYDAPGTQDSRIYWVRHVLSAVLPNLEAIYGLQDSNNKLYLIRRLHDLDSGTIGVAEWILMLEVKMLKKTLTELKMSTLGRFERDLELWKANNSLTIFSSLVKEAESTYEWTISTLLGRKGQEGQGQEGDGMGEEDIEMEVEEEGGLDIMKGILSDIADTEIFYESIEELLEAIAEAIVTKMVVVDREFRMLLMTILLREVRAGKFVAFKYVLHLVSGGEGEEGLVFDERSSWEFGEAIEVAISKRDGEDSGAGAVDECVKSIYRLLEKLTPSDKSGGDSSVLVIRGLTETGLGELVNWLEEKLPKEKGRIEELKLRWTVGSGDENPRGALEIIPTTFNFKASLDDWVERISRPSLHHRQQSQQQQHHASSSYSSSVLQPPSTPPSQNAELLGMMITVSPPNALLRSPEVKGLTKTYSNNDFRQLRQQSSTRQNTSRMPSRHVDDFEQESTVAPLNLNNNAVSSSSPLPAAPFPLHPHHPSLPMNPTFYQQ